jgi:hypothetical protein
MLLGMSHLSKIVKIDRRRFLLTSAAAATSLRALAQTPRSTTLTLHPDQSGPTVPANFVGLSYETQQLTDPDFFSPQNTGLVAQFRALTAHGVLRLGGNTSDVGWWKPTPSSAQPPLPAKVVVIPLRPEERPFQELAYSVTPQAIVNLRKFLDATGWTCLYGINLGTSTPERAAAEGAFVYKTLGPTLEYFQLGNEPDIFFDRFRVKKDWNPNVYFDEWIASVRAILAVAPHAKFGLPDTAGNQAWTSAIADRLLTLPDHSFVAAISHHHYFGGPPSSPDVTIAKLMVHQQKVRDAYEVTQTAAHRLGTLYRMTEGNTCYRGGKPGVSDVFAASLWAADYLLTLASWGYAGVNLHGGSGKAVADSLGGTLPGELLMPNPKAPHPRPFYTPIAEVEGKYVAEPVFYGLKFASAFQGATIIPTDFDPGPINATAFAAKLPSGQTVIAIINKDTTQPLPINLPGFGLTLTMSATSLTSTKVDMTEPARNREASTVPPGTAILLHSSR